MKNGVIFSLILLLCSCKTEPNVNNIESGEFVQILHTENFFLGTDTTIVIINGKDGKILNEISRTNQLKHYRSYHEEILSNLLY